MKIENFLGKKNFTIFIMLILLFTLLFVVGCTNTEPTTTNVNFKVGFAKPLVEFVSNNPPQSIYPNSNFHIMMELDNKMAYDMENTKISLIGIDEMYFKLDKSNEDIGFLEGRSLYNQDGGMTIIDIPAVSGDLFGGAEKYVNDYYLKLNYNSKVEFGESVCVSSALYDIYDSGCHYNPKMSFTGQGAPVGVVTLEQAVYPAGAGADIEFIATFKNRGTGKMNTLFLDDAKLGGKNMDCEILGSSAKRSVVFESKDVQEVKVRCKTFVDTQTSYTSTVSMSFSYDYEQKDKYRLTLVNPLPASSYIR